VSRSGGGVDSGTLGLLQGALLLYCCFTAALLLLYCCFTFVLLLLYYCFIFWIGARSVAPRMGLSDAAAAGKLVVKLVVKLAGKLVC
jgi:hypothetical protein